MVQLLYPKTKRKKKSKVKEWESARRVLKEAYMDKGITTCELHLNGCTGAYALSFAHRYKRRDPRCEHTYEGTLLACMNCHQKIEINKDLTNYYFNKLR